MDERLNRPLPKSKALRWGVGLLVVGLAAVGWRASQVEGWLQPIHVSGPSMSPTLWGPHRTVACPTCGLSHRIQAVAASPPHSLKCFGCGHRQVRVSNAVQLGDRVLIDRAAYRAAAPERDDLVAIRKADGGLQVKRVVGCPGQRLRIDAAGALFIDGRQQHLTPDQSWQRSILVYDDRYPGPDGSRWRNTDPGGWHTYHHVDIRGAKKSASFPPSSVRDDDPANATLSRLTRPVADLQLEVQVQASKPCQLQLVFATAGEPLSAAILLPAGGSQIRVTKIGSRLWQLTDSEPPRLLSGAPAGGPRATATSGTAADASTWGSNDPQVADCRPVAVRLITEGPADETEARFTHLWLGRSPRFDPPAGLADRWRRGVTVAEDHYIVLGDNPPASEDSRSNPEGIPREHILGQVIRWPW